MFKKKYSRFMYGEKKEPHIVIKYMSIVSTVCVSFCGVRMCLCEYMWSTDARIRYLSQLFLLIFIYFI